MLPALSIAMHIFAVHIVRPKNVCNIVNQSMSGLENSSTELIVRQIKHCSNLTFLNEYFFVIFIPLQTLSLSTLQTISICFLLRPNLFHYHV